MSDRVDVIPAILGWGNPERDTENLRLYALDRGAAPRWDGRPGRVAEQGIRETATPLAREGDRFLLVRVGERVTDEVLEVITARITAVLIEELPNRA